MKRAAAVGRHPDVCGRTAGNSGDRARRRICTQRFERISLIEDRTLFFATARAYPQSALRIRFQRVDKKAPRPAYYFLCLAIFDQEESATLRACVQLVTDHREARNLQRPR